MKEEKVGEITHLLSFFLHLPSWLVNGHLNDVPSPKGYRLMKEK